jgi:hypothetical protein
LLQWLFSVTTVLSLVLSLASFALWVESHYVCHTLQLPRQRVEADAIRGQTCLVFSGAGTLEATYRRWGLD